MYRMIIVTALGNYVVEMVPEKEEPTADELMKMFLETKADVESGCFMEGWTPTDGLSGAPGVFAIGKGLEILAYHVERHPEFDLPPINPDNVNTRRPLSLKFSYLGNEMIAKCIQDDIGSVAVIFCYAVNGEPPTDVLNTKKLSESLCSCIPGGKTDCGNRNREYDQRKRDSGESSRIDGFPDQQFNRGL